MNFIKRYSPFLVFIFLASFLFGNTIYAADATFGSYILDGVSTIVYLLVSVVGEGIGLMISIFIWVIQYNNFGNETLILVGWEIIRDLCNMGFVVILLIMAISSILQIESYGYRNRLFKILLMAVLINFSKLFTLLLIDISQYIMLEFAAGIKNVGEGNFIDILGINTFLNTDFSAEYSKAGPAETTNVTFWSIGISIILALVVSVVALFVVAALTIIMIIRIVALWILIIFSPMAYLLAFSPVGQRYSSQWWAKFTSYCVTGPVMVFLVWLALSSMKATTSSLFSGMSPDGLVGLAAIGSPSIMGAFLFACIMLLASLKVAQELGGMAGSVASKASNKLSSMGSKVGSFAAKSPLKSADWLNRVQAEKTGLDLNLKRSVGGKFKEVMAQRRADQGVKIRESANKNLGGREGLGGALMATIGGTDDLQTRLKHGVLFKNTLNAARTTRLGVGQYTVGGTTSKMFKEQAKAKGIEIKQKREDLGKIISKQKVDNEKQQLTDESKSINQRLVDIKQNLTSKEASVIEKQNEISKITGQSKASKQRREVKEKELSTIQDSISGLKQEETEKNARKQKIEARQTELEKIVATVDTEEEAELKRAGLKTKIEDLESDRNKLSRSAKERAIDTTPADIIKRKRIEEKKSEWEKDPDMNFRELIYRFQKALDSGKTDEAQIAMEIATKNNDIGKFLKHFDFNETAGLTQEEYDSIDRDDNRSREDRDAEITQRKGLHDFIRENFIGTLKMEEQKALDAQSSIAGIAKKNNNLNFAESVVTDEDTNAYKQVNQTEQAALTSKMIQGRDMATFFKSGESEKMFGGRNNKNKWDLNALGLESIVSNSKIMEEQIDNNRFNPLLALRFTEEQNLERMKNAVNYVAEENRGQYLNMITKLENYAKTKGGSAEGVKDRIAALTGIINKTPDNKTKPAEDIVTGRPSNVQQSNVTNNPSVSSQTDMSRDIHEEWQLPTTPQNPIEVNNVNNIVNNFVTNAQSNPSSNSNMFNDLRLAIRKLTNDQTMFLLKNLKKNSENLRKEIKLSPPVKANVLNNKLIKNEQIVNNVEQYYTESQGLSGSRPSEKFEQPIIEENQGVSKAEEEEEATGSDNFSDDDSIKS